MSPASLTGWRSIPATGLTGRPYDLAGARENAVEQRHDPVLRVVRQQPWRLRLLARPGSRGLARAWPHGARVRRRPRSSISSAKAPHRERLCPRGDTDRTPAVGTRRRSSDSRAASTASARDRAPHSAGTPPPHPRKSRPCAPSPAACRDAPGRTRRAASPPPGAWCSSPPAGGRAPSTPGRSCAAPGARRAGGTSRTKPVRACARRERRDRSGAGSGCPACPKDTNSLGHIWDTVTFL